MSIEEIEKRHDDKDLREYFFKRTWIREREREIISWMMNQFSDEIAMTDQRKD